MVTLKTNSNLPPPKLHGLKIQKPDEFNRVGIPERRNPAFPFSLLPGATGSGVSQRETEAAHGECPPDKNFPMRTSSDSAAPVWRIPESAFWTGGEQEACAMPSRTSVVQQLLRQVSEPKVAE